MRVVLSFVACIWISYGGGLQEAHGQSFLVPLVEHHAGRSLVKLERHKVHVTIKGRMAHTTIEQVYHNPTARQLEAHYLFALPPGAVVSRLAMTTNQKGASRGVETPAVSPCFSWNLEVSFWFFAIALAFRALAPCLSLVDFSVVR